MTGSDPRELRQGPNALLRDVARGGRSGPAPRRSLLSLPHLLREFRASGRISEAQMLDVLAARTGTERVPLSLLPPDPDLADLLPPQTCLRHGLVPWRRDGAELILATCRPETLFALDTIVPRAVADGAAATGRPGRTRAVLATRSEVQGHVAQTHRSALTAAMSARPPAEQSCRTWARDPLDGVLMLVLAGLALLAAALLAPVALFAALTVWAGFTMIVAIVLKIAAAVAHLTRPAPAPPPATGLSELETLRDLPTISILVPLFREREIASTLIRRLQRLDYPRGRLDVLLVLEETDTATIEAVAATALPPWMRSVIVPDGRPRTKPRAMNYALDFCEGEIIGIYDAEDAPDPDQLLKVAARFAAAPPEVACLQGVLDYYNPRQTWLARCFTVEYNTWFRLVLPGMAQMGLVIPLGGTTLFVRRDVLESVGGWDAHNVTEDADLGFRLARGGWRTESLDTTTGEEANCHVLPWVRQRSRWLKGYMVTWLVHMRRPRQTLRDLGAWRFVGMQAHFLTALSQFFLAPFLWSFWLFPLGLPHPLGPWLPQGWITAAAIAFLTAEAVTIGLGMIATRGPAHRHLWPWVPTLHLYWPLGCLAAWKAFLELAICPFYWDKTTHGHSLATPQTPVPATAPAAPAPSTERPDAQDAAAREV